MLQLIPDLSLILSLNFEFCQNLSYHSLSNFSFEVSHLVILLPHRLKKSFGINALYQRPLSIEVISKELTCSRHPVVTVATSIGLLPRDIFPPQEARLRHPEAIIAICYLDAIATILSTQGPA